jgi:hypothetical protein
MHLSKQAPKVILTTTTTLNWCTIAPNEALEHRPVVTGMHGLAGIVSDTRAMAEVQNR